MTTRSQVSSTETFEQSQHHKSLSGNKADPLSIQPLPDMISVGGEMWKVIRRGVFAFQIVHFLFKAFRHQAPLKVI